MAALAEATGLAQPQSQLQFVLMSRSEVEAASSRQVAGVRLEVSTHWTAGWLPAGLAACLVAPLVAPLGWPAVPPALAVNKQTVTDLK